MTIGWHGTRVFCASMCTLELFFRWPVGWKEHRMKAISFAELLPHKLTELWTESKLSFLKLLYSPSNDVQLDLRLKLNDQKCV